VLPALVTENEVETKIIGISGSFTPTNLPLAIQNLLSTGLTNVEFTGEVKAALATSWELSEDDKEYIFRLRDDLLWHDGKKFTAYDINYNLKDVTFEPIDDTTLKVVLKEPFTPLPSFLSKPLFRKGLVGIGSYRVESVKLNGEFVSLLSLEPMANDLPVIDIRFYPTEAAAKTAFKLGEVNVIDEISDPVPFTDWPNIMVKESVKYNQYVGLFFNNQNSLFQEKDIRQALSFVIEKQEANRVVSPISSKSWAYTTRVKSYEQDINKAQELVAGFGLDDGTEVTLTTFPQFFSLAHKIASAWETLGIKTKIKIESRLPQSYQVVLATQEVPVDPDQYTLWHSTQEQTNISNYTNPKIDKLLEDGRKELDQEKRAQIYFDFQRYLVDDAPAVFLFHPTKYTISRM